MFYGFLSVLYLALATLSIAQECMILKRCDSLKPKDIAFILNLHNGIRDKIRNGLVEGQPMGKDLKEMKWDEHLAKQAQWIANTCEEKHVKVTENNAVAGQNLAREETSNCPSNVDWESAIEGQWFKEHKNYIYPQLSNNTLHYTQLVWGNTDSVGCGCTIYLKPDKNLYQQLIVCNYLPAGNVLGQAPYKEA